MLASWQVKAKHVMSSMCCFLPAGLRVSRVSNPAMGQQHPHLEAMTDPRISQHRTRLLPANVSLKELEVAKNAETSKLCKLKLPDKMEINIYLQPFDDPCFDWKRPCLGELTFKNRGHLGSRYVYIYTYIYIERVFYFDWFFFRGLGVN